MDQLGYHWTDFYKILCTEFLLKSVNKKVWLQSDTNSRYLPEDLRTHIYGTGFYVGEIMCSL